jgi:hypothetical protein
MNCKRCGRCPPGELAAESARFSLDCPRSVSLKDKWASEPWKAVEGQVFIKGEEGWGSIVDSQDWFIAKLEDSLDPQANAERIVDCVNALRGLEPKGVAQALQALEECAAVLALLRDGAQEPLATRARTAASAATAALAALGRSNSPAR